MWKKALFTFLALLALAMVLWFVWNATGTTTAGPVPH